MTEQMQANTEAEKIADDAVRRAKAAKRREDLEEAMKYYLGLAKAVENREPVYTTDEVVEKYEITSFLAPIVRAVDRETFESGTLTFSHSPRFYYGWEPV